MKYISKKVSILGSTGSIGCNSLQVIDNLRKQGMDIDVLYLTTNSRIDELAAQIKKYSPHGVVIHDKIAYAEFRSKYDFKELEVLTGKEGLNEITSRDDYNFLINALVGFSGLIPTIEAIKSGKDIALANKETLVAGGKLVTDLARKNNVNILPIDSEHSAILQCSVGENKNDISRLILTASGGPFHSKTLEEIKETSVEDALAHPNWKMGNKITIDSATMMNKGLEVIEAKWLFEIEIKNIEVVIHPQSIIHSMVEFKDGSVKAQLGLPDMKIPIQYSLTYPERMTGDSPKIDFKKINLLTFEEPDYVKFKCLKIAYDVIKESGIYPTILNASNEVAVDLFLKRKIKFLEIPDIIEKQLNKHSNQSVLTIENILESDTLTRQQILEEYF